MLPGAKGKGTATIANGASLSSSVGLGNGSLVGIQMPSGWDAANLTFQVSQDDVTFTNLYDDLGSEYTVVAAASRGIILNPDDFMGWAYIKIRSGTAAGAVNQTADRSLSLMLRG